MPDEKLIHIESLLAHQERQIHDLNDVVQLQWKQIDVLKGRLDRMMSKISDIEATSPGDGMSVADAAKADKPPHY